MRSLQTRDLFNAVRVIKEIGVREEIKKVALDKGEKDANTIGLDLLFSIIEKATEKNTEQKLYGFLCGPFECTTKEIEEMDLLELFEKITEVANINKWKDFLSKAAQLIK